MKDLDERFLILDKDNISKPYTYFVYIYINIYINIYIYIYI